MEFPNNKIYLADIVHDTIVDGEGWRSTIYCAFCLHNCHNCHNPKYKTLELAKLTHINDIFNELTSNEETNVTFSGGDPFFQPIAFSNLAKRIKGETNKTIWIYSGYTYEEIIKDNNKLKLLELCDVLVDGRFIEELKDLNLSFRGSGNQRIIDIKESLKMRRVVEYKLEC